MPTSPRGRTFEVPCPLLKDPVDARVLRYTAVALGAGIPKALFLGRLIVKVVPRPAAAAARRAKGSRRSSRRSRGKRK